MDRSPPKIKTLYILVLDTVASILFLLLFLLPMTTNAMPDTAGFSGLSMVKLNIPIPLERPKPEDNALPFFPPPPEPSLIPDALGRINLGTFNVTAYCPCKQCCGKDEGDPGYGITAIGTRATEGRTIAVDPDVIPYGTKVYFNGGTYVAEDCGGAIQGNHIDLYFDSHEAALEWGYRQREVLVDADYKGDEDMKAKDKFQVIIAGGRDFSDYDLLERKCDFYFSERRPSLIIVGGANGADDLGMKYAFCKCYDFKIMRADWNTLGKAAGMVRNQQMLQEADALVAFWDGRSSGTRNMIEIAQAKGIPVRIVYY